MTKIETFKMNTQNNYFLTFNSNRKTKTQRHISKSPWALLVNCFGGCWATGETSIVNCKCVADKAEKSPTEP